MMKRRMFLGGFAAGAMMMAGWPTGVWALEASTAKAHVEATVAEMLAIVQGSGDAAAKAQSLKGLMTSRAAMPQISRFVAGRAWRDMDSSQQAAFSEAFLHFVSTVYARRFQGYAGETVTVGSTSDEGRKGILVRSKVSQSSGAPISVDWLVTDRPGRVVIADIVIEGVSLLLTQRDEVAGMLSAKGGDINALISDLSGA